MTRSKKVSLEKAKQTPNPRKRSVAQAESEDEIAIEVNSPSIPLSDSEDTYINQDGEVQFDQLQKHLEHGKRTYEDNVKAARTFEESVKQRNANLLRVIAEHREEIQNDGFEFVKAFLPVLHSALKPMSVKRGNTDIDPENSQAIKVSTITAEDLDLFKYSEDLCRETVAFFEIYSSLEKRKVPERRIAIAHDLMEVDKVTVTKMIEAGAKNAKLQAQIKLAGQEIVSNQAIRLTRDEENDAVLFERNGDSTLGKANGDNLKWEPFTRGLKHAIQKIERLVENE